MPRVLMALGTRRLKFTLLYVNSRRKHIWRPGRDG